MAFSGRSTGSSGVMRYLRIRKSYTEELRRLFAFSNCLSLKPWLSYTSTFRGSFINSACPTSPLAHLSCNRLMTHIAFSSRKPEILSQPFPEFGNRRGTECLKTQPHLAGYSGAMILTISEPHPQNVELLAGAVRNRLRTGGLVTFSSMNMQTLRASKEEIGLKSLIRFFNSFSRSRNKSNISSCSWQFLGQEGLKSEIRRHCIASFDNEDIVTLLGDRTKSYLLPRMRRRRLPLKHLRAPKGLQNTSYRRIEKQFSQQHIQPVQHRLSDQEHTNSPSHSPLVVKLSPMPFETVDERGSRLRPAPGPTYPRAEITVETTAVGGNGPGPRLAYRTGIDMRAFTDNISKCQSIKQLALSSKLQYRIHSPASLALHTRAAPKVPITTSPTSQTIPLNPTPNSPVSPRGNVPLSFKMLPETQSETLGYHVNVLHTLATSKTWEILPHANVPSPAPHEILTYSCINQGTGKTTEASLSVHAILPPPQPPGEQKVPPLVVCCTRAHDRAPCISFAYNAHRRRSLLLSACSSSEAVLSASIPCVLRACVFASIVDLQTAGTPSPVCPPRSASRHTSPSLHLFNQPVHLFRVAPRVRVLASLACPSSADVCSWLVPAVNGGRTMADGGAWRRPNHTRLGRMRSVGRHGGWVQGSNSFCRTAGHAGLPFIFFDTIVGHRGGVWDEYRRDRMVDWGDAGISFMSVAPLPITQRVLFVLDKMLRICLVSRFWADERVSSPGFPACPEG
ncbi:uncharacterized protein CLUP02_01214 [Colletotrichum lupini]|uniref:Uncharacterized protein n=1 Tax=Colletotrichum lupini TaxID=145971 RepID=A0A9Q8SCI6_9PEZI|nr:uncharacterized protein CLUP02_01214 [Colletotrichum lupini]UQC74563.1 hypothetical protein CLUP02_01214 [Colletotrichum lupini]